MIGRLRQLSEPRLRWQAGVEKSKRPVERDILVQCVRIIESMIEVEIETRRFEARFQARFQVNTVRTTRPEKCDIFAQCYLSQPISTKFQKHC